MIAVRDVPAPERRELRACGLAALAEAGIAALPAHLVLTETRGIDLALLPFVLAFAAAYVAGALLACRFRSSRNLATAAAILGVVAGISLGGGDVNRTVFAVVVALVVAVRLVAIGVRDWRTPWHAEFGLGAAALGLETLVAAGAEPDWRPIMVVVVPTFFVAGLASRATTVWTSGGVHDLDEDVRAAWVRRAIAGTLALVAAMAAVVALAMRGGAFDRLGVWLTPLADAFAAGFGWLLGQAARPIFWLVDRIGIDPDRVREFFERLAENGLAERGRDDLTRPDAALWQRLLGLLVFVAIGYGLFRAIRRARPAASVEPAASAGVRVHEEPLLDEVPPTHRPLRRELPADAVRRWYAEVLIALERRGSAKDPSLTPAELVRAVAADVPGVREDLAVLTRAYEDVRYGNLRVDRDALRALERSQDRLVSALAAPPREGVSDR